MGTIRSLCDIAHQAHAYQPDVPEGYEAGVAAGIEMLAYYITSAGMDVDEMLAAIVPGIEISD